MANLVVDQVCMEPSLFIHPSTSVLRPALHRSLEYVCAFLIPTEWIDVTKIVKQASVVLEGVTRHDGTAMN